VKINFILKFTISASAILENIELTDAIYV
jgi:hypothetical protein